MDALAEGGAIPTVLNAANEIAVERFLEGRLAFAGLARTVRQICEQFSKDGFSREVAGVEDALAVDHIARERTRTILA